MLDALLRRYPWLDHLEGMKFAEIERDALRSVGHWLFLPGAISAFHRVTNCGEIWAIHAGALTVYTINPTGLLATHRLGSDFNSGQVPLISVPIGCWQAAELPAGVAFAFGTNVCAPGFDYSEFELGRREQLLSEFPQHRALIERLTQGTSRSA